MSFIDCSRVLDKSFFENKLFSNHFSNKKLNYSVLKNCFIIPHPSHGFGGLVNEKKDYIKDSALHNLIHKVEYNFPNCDDCISETVIYFGVISKGWGHFLTDSLKRAWFFLNNNDFDNYKIIAISDDDKEPAGNFRRIFELLGIDLKRFVFINKNTKLKSVIYPDSSFFCDETDNRRYFTNEYRETIRKIKDASIYNSKYENIHKVYFPFSNYRRNKHSLKRAIGEKNIEKLFKNAGYAIIRPEKLSVDDQISLLKNAEWMASTDGSCSHNSIFLNDYSNLIIIPRGPYSSEYQDALNFVNDLKIYYIDSSLSVFCKEESPWGGPFYFYSSDNLLSFFHTKKRKQFKFKDFNKYILLASASNPGNKPFVHNKKLKNKFDELYLNYIRKKLLYFLHRLVSFLKSF